MEASKPDYAPRPGGVMYNQPDSSAPSSALSSPPEPGPGGDALPSPKQQQSPPPAAPPRAAKTPQAQAQAPQAEAPQPQAPQPQTPQPQTPQPQAPQPQAPASAPTPTPYVSPQPAVAAGEYGHMEHLHAQQQYHMQQQHMQMQYHMQMQHQMMIQQQHAEMQGGYTHTGFMGAGYNVPAPAFSGTAAEPGALGKLTATGAAQQAAPGGQSRVAPAPAAGNGRRVQSTTSSAGPKSEPSRQQRRQARQQPTDSGPEAGQAGGTFGSKLVAPMKGVGPSCAADPRGHSPGGSDVLSATMPSDSTRDALASALGPSDGVGSEISSQFSSPLSLLHENGTCLQNEEPASGLARGLPTAVAPPSSGMQPAAGVIFGCMSSTYDECFDLSMVGLPRKYLPLVSSIVAGHTLLFLFNFSNRQMHGVYVATSNGQENLSVTAWKSLAPTPKRDDDLEVDSDEGSPFPAQCSFGIVEEFAPVPEAEFRHILEYTERQRFKFKLSRWQCRDLVETMCSYDAKLRTRRLLDELSLT